MEVVTEKPKEGIDGKLIKTELGHFPYEWETSTLEELCYFITKGSTPTTYGFDWKSSGVKFLRSECVSEFGLDLEPAMYISDEANHLLRRSEIQSGDILMTITGNVGRVIFLDESFGKGNINQHIARVRVNTDKVDTQYVFHFLSRPQIKKYFYSILTGQAYPQISLKQVRELPIYFPKTLKEQQAIAESLSDVDALIAELNALIEKKQQVKKGAMQQLLTGKKRLPGFDGEWEEKKLGDVAHVQRGASPRPISSPRWFSLKKAVGWVRISDISDSDGKNLLKTKDYLSKAGIERSRFLPKGSLILSIAATVGLPVITRIDTCIHDGFVGLTNLEVDQEFLYYKLKELENDLVEMGQTGSQNNINSTIVRNVKTLFPPLEEQKAIAGILSDMDMEIEALQSKRSKYKKIKQGMMQELLTGKTRLI